MANRVEINEGDTGGSTIAVAGLATALGPLHRRVTIDGGEHCLSTITRDAEDTPRGERIEYRGPGSPVRLVEFRSPLDDGLRSEFLLVNDSPKRLVLNSVELLGLDAVGCVGFDSGASRLRALEQGAYWGHVVDFAPESGERDGASDLVWVLADEASGASMLVGFETAHRWKGTIQTRVVGEELAALSVGFDGGDTAIEPRATVQLEDLLILAGDDPLDLLDRYGETTRARHQPDILAESPVTWCSWYPHRLGVTHERVMRNARVAAERLKPLGLSTMLVDLGWQEGWLPSIFDEKDEFPGGLRALADDLAELGLDLGVWSAPTSISAHDPVAQERPEWLVPGEDGSPREAGTWFWAPHGPIHILDLTHPGARGWLRERIALLAERGCRYFKGDFVGNIQSGDAKRRHDDSIVGGGGLETGHIAARIFMDALREHRPDALVLSCGGPELPGPSASNLLYSCDDTGNTGYVGWELLRRTQLSIATHLFKHRRWGVIQPSCMSTGLPGTIDEARVRATTAFMSGGQIDIGDDLTKLPEDRWRILTATLPPYGKAARPIDLFTPIQRARGGYSTATVGTGIDLAGVPPAPPASVWALPIDAGWDSWTLVAVFSYDLPDIAGDRGEAQLDTFFLPVERLGLPPRDDLWAYEFWSGQFSGNLPADPPPMPDYQHPGDMQSLVARPDSGTLAVSFFGPGVKLLAVRRAPDHPWVAGTDFHQSCGFELADVRWEPGTGTLSGSIDRPAGTCGAIALAGFGASNPHATVNGSPASARTGSGGSLVVPVSVESEGTLWEVRFD